MSPNLCDKSMIDSLAALFLKWRIVYYMDVQYMQHWLVLSPVEENWERGLFLGDTRCMAYFGWW